MNVVYHGPAHQVLSSFQDKYIQTCVTSPPYWLQRVYGVEDRFHDGWVGELGLEQTPEQYVSHVCDVFDQVWRVLRDDGSLWLNLGDTYFGTGYGQPHTGRAAISPSHWPQVRPKSHHTIRPQELVGIPWMVVFELRRRGWYLRSDIIWAKVNPFGDGPVKNRPKKSHEHVFLLTKQPTGYYYNEVVVREPSGRALRDVWYLESPRDRNEHYATIPLKLVENCVLAGSRPGDWVLDPFCGTGTVGQVASDNHRNFVGIELNVEHFRTAQNRLLTARDKAV